MLEYNFFDLIDKARFLPPELYNDICSTPFSTNSKDWIDEIWDRTEKSFNKNPTGFHKYFTVLKPEVLMSLYATLTYTTLKPMSYNDFFSAYKETDNALKNPDSAEAERTNLAHHKKALKDKMAPGQCEVLTSGQLFDSRSIFYLSQFWQKEDYIKCFNISSFVKYIKAHSYWPFFSSNLDGMTFSNYFKGIREMTTEWDFYSEDNTNFNNTFEEQFSCYILEELFSPVSFIQNMTLHLNTFKDILFDYKTNTREKSFILMQPLFRLPNRLWKLLSEPYENALYEYITNPKNHSTYNEFINSMKNVIQISQYIFPLLKLILGERLYSCFMSIERNPCFAAEASRSALEKYIKKQLGSFDYFTPLRSNMCSLAKLMYPETAKNKKVIPVDTVGNSLLHKITPERNSSKSENTALKSYEINFTYYFFCRPEFPDYLNWIGKPKDMMGLFTCDRYIQYMTSLNEAQPSTKMSNYLRTQASKNE